MLIERDLIKEIKPFIERKECLAIIGPRQSGKTTFLKMLESYLIEKSKIEQEKIKIITFENRKLLMEFEQDPIRFVTSFFQKNMTGKCFLLIDEFQYAEDGGQKLKFIYDTIDNIKIIITGSSSLDIKANTGKYMVGRMLTFHLFPFNFGEVLKVRDSRLARIYQEESRIIQEGLLKGDIAQIKRGQDAFAGELIKEFENYCIWGGYPAVVLSSTEQERKKVLADIFNNYVLKDIKTILELATEKNLYALSQQLSAQLGNIIVYNNLGTAAGLNFRQLKKHLAILEETYICHQIRPFFRNRQKELSKNPKIYFTDLGFRNNLMENMNDFARRTDSGALVENAMYIRLRNLQGDTNKVNFWRTKTGAEVDFVLHAQGAEIPVEIKYTEYSAEKVPRSFVSFIELFKPKQAVILTKNFWGKMQKGETMIFFAPVYYL